MISLLFITTVCHVFGYAQDLPTLGSEGDSQFNFRGEKARIVQSPTLASRNFSSNPLMKLFSDLFGPYPFRNEKYGHYLWPWGGDGTSDHDRNREL